MTDQLRTLIFDKASARAQLVSLETSWQKAAANHPAPACVLELLGQLMAASAMLSASLKFDGSLILQIQGDGPVRLMVAECNSTLGLRATFKLRDDLPLNEGASFQELVNLDGRGICAIILDPHNRQPGQAPYQGLVPLVGNSVAQALESYMHSSEQLETRLVLQANAQRAVGLMLQQMPTGGGKSTEAIHDADGWDRLLALSQTLQADEHLNTPLDELAKRLFWEEEAEMLADRLPHFHCTCSADKVRRMLVSLGPEEIEQALAEKPVIEVQCDFCGAAYAFDKAACDGLFASDDDQNHTGQTLH